MALINNVDYIPLLVRSVDTTNYIQIASLSATTFARILRQKLKNKRGGSSVFTCMIWLFVHCFLLPCSSAFSGKSADIPGNKTIVTRLARYTRRQFPWPHLFEDQPRSQGRCDSYRTPRNLSMHASTTAVAPNPSVWVTWSSLGWSRTIYYLVLKLRIRNDVQWSPSTTDTIGNQNFVRNSEVSVTQGLPVYFR